MSATLHVSEIQKDWPPSGTIVRVSWKQQLPAPHEFLAIACPDEEAGGYSIFAANFAGIVSQGDTLEEAKANIAEAFLAMLEAVEQSGRKLAFTPIPTVIESPGCVRLWISVDG